MRYDEMVAILASEEHPRRDELEAYILSNPDMEEMYLRAMDQALDFAFAMFEPVQVSEEETRKILEQVKREAALSQSPPTTCWSRPSCITELDAGRALLLSLIDAAGDNIELMTLAGCFVLARNPDWVVKRVPSHWSVEVAKWKRVVENAPGPNLASALASLKNALHYKAVALEESNDTILVKRTSVIHESMPWFVYEARLLWCACINEKNEKLFVQEVEISEMLDAKDDLYKNYHASAC